MSHTCTESITTATGAPPSLPRRQHATIHNLPAALEEFSAACPLSQMGIFFPSGNEHDGWDACSAFSSSVCSPLPPPSPAAVGTDTTALATGPQGTTTALLFDPHIRIQCVPPLRCGGGGQTGQALPAPPRHRRKRPRCDTDGRPSTPQDSHIGGEAEAEAGEGEGEGKGGRGAVRDEGPPLIMIELEDEEGSQPTLLTPDSDTDTDRHHQDQAAAERGVLEATAATAAAPFFTLGDPIDAAHIRRLFSASNIHKSSSPAAAAEVSAGRALALVGQNPVQEDKHTPAVTVAGGGGVDVASTTIACPAAATIALRPKLSVSASSADLEALSFLFPAVHAGRLYATAAAFLDHCQRCDEHLFLCEDLPLVPVHRHALTVAAAGGENGSQTTINGIITSGTGGGSGGHAGCFASRQPGTIVVAASGDGPFLRWFCLLHGVISARLACALAADWTGEQPEALQWWLSFRVSLLLARRVTSTSGGGGANSAAEEDGVVPATCGWVASSATIPTFINNDHDDPTTTAAAASHSAPFVNWASLLDAATEVEAVLLRQWECLCINSLHVASTTPSSSSTSSSISTLPMVSPTLRATVESDFFRRRLPPLLLSLVLPVARALVTETRRGELSLRLQPLRVSPPNGEYSDVDSDCIADEADGDVNDDGDGSASSSASFSSWCPSQRRAVDAVARGRINDDNGNGNGSNSGGGGRTGPSDDGMADSSADGSDWDRCLRLMLALHLMEYKHNP